jgi:ATP adenylyltransferase
VQVERLWTPWRKVFVEGTASDDGATLTCFLCSGPADQADRANLILARAQRSFVVMNLYPYNTGHVLVAPYAHVGDFAALDADTAAELMHMTQRCVAALQAVYRPHGFNIGMNLGRPAGAGLPDHLHVHVVPRWNGDTNFMPILAGTKVLPEGLDQTYDRLEPVFRA